MAADKRLSIYALVLGALCILSKPVGATPLFEAAVPYDCGDSPQSIAAGYFNADSTLDLVTANQDDHDVSVFIGNGDGTFAPEVRYGVGTLTCDVEIADMNNDGLNDLVVGTDDIVVLYGVGDGTFGTAMFVAEPKTKSLVVADLDGDVHLDIGAVGYYIDSAYVILSHDTNTWVSPAFYASDSQLVSITAANLDADSYLDLAVVTSRDGIWMYTNDGTGAFTSTQIKPNGSEYPTQIIAEDFNGDNETDLAIAQYTSEDFVVLLSNGDGTFQAEISTSAPNKVRRIATADFDGDLVLDMMVSINLDNTAAFFKGAGDGTFTLDSAYSVGDSPASIATGDFDNDGYVDVAVVALDDSNVSILMNRTALILDVDDGGPDMLPGNFTLSQNYPNPFNPTTSISYTLARKSNVQFSVLNVLGQSVRTLVNHEESVGTYTVTWDGRDDSGDLVASGVYFYRLRTADGTQTRKMSLLK